MTTGLLLSVALNTKMMSFIYNNKNNIQAIRYGDTYVQFVYDEKDRVASFFVKNDVDETSQNSWCVALFLLKSCRISLLFQNNIHMSALHAEHLILFICIMFTCFIFVLNFSENTFYLNL